MSITSEINRIKGNIADAYTAADGKGATLPVTQDSANLASCISSISTGSSPVIQSLSITPTTSQQTHTAPTGVDGYSPVTVSAVDSNIDPNILSNNIKSGVTILGITGSYVGEVETITATNNTSSAISSGDKVFVEELNTKTRNFTNNTTYSSVDDNTEIFQPTTQYSSRIYPDRIIDVAADTEDLVYYFSIDYTNATNAYTNLFNMLPFKLYTQAGAEGYQGGLYCGMNINSSNMTVTYGYYGSEGSSSNIEVDSSSPFYQISKGKIYYRFTYKTTGEHIYEASFNGINYTQIFSKTYQRKYIYAYFNPAAPTNYGATLEVPGNGGKAYLGDCKLMKGSTVVWKPYTTTTEHSIVVFNDATSDSVTGQALENISVNSSGRVRTLKTN